MATGEGVSSRDPHIPSRFTAEERLREMHPAFRRHIGKRVAPPAPSAPVRPPAGPRPADAPAGEAEDAPHDTRSVVCACCGQPFKATRQAMALAKGRGFALRCPSCRTARKNEQMRLRARRMSKKT
jgi:hypothetical protein